MSSRLPPLNSIRAFEVAARHLSFTRAAEELCVTHGAVSRHIANLEGALGVRLFVRGARQLDMTDAARDYLEAVQSAFGTLKAATNDIATRDGNTVRICALQSFVSRWLMHRLRGIDDLKVEITLATVDVPVNFDSGDIDVSIEVHPSERANTSCYKLLDIDLTPICNPDSVNGRPPPQTLADLERYTLLHSRPTRQTHQSIWQTWAEGAGMKALDAQAHSYFPTFDLVFHAAKQGLGVGIGGLRFIEDDLRAGTIIAPFDIAVPYQSYYIVIPDASLRLPHVARFRDWILSESIG